MSIRALQDYTVYAKYAKYDPNKQRRETWEEQVDRVFDMHERRFSKQLETNEQFKDDFYFAKKQVLKRRILGSQRALQFGGSSIEKHEAKIYNCIVSYCDRERFFQECMYLLLCGCGTGFSVQKTHIHKLPNLIGPSKEPGNVRNKGTKKFTIPDSIEGWADAIGVVINSFFDGSSVFSEYNGYKIQFDFSNIRPEGALISGGFKAPGPEGLKKSIDKIVTLIESRINSKEFHTDEFKGKLRPIDAYDIIMHMSDAVLSGGVRRSATICLFSPDDPLMLAAKTGDWFIKNPQRGRSNNSVLLIRNKTTQEDFENIMNSVKEFGEPGFVWAEDEGVLYNPCLDGDTMIETTVGSVKLRDICENPIKYKVLSYNEDTFELEYESVKCGLKTKENANIIKIEFDDDTILELTPDHRIFTENRGYVKASQLSEDDEIVSIEFDNDIYKSTEEVTVNSYIDQDAWTNRVIEDCS